MVASTNGRHRAHKSTYGRGALAGGLHPSLAESKAMSTLELEQQIPVRTPGISKNTIVRYALLIFAAGYVVVSLHLIFDTRNRLTSVVTAQQAAIGQLQQRQAATEDELKVSEQQLAKQLGMTERELQAAEPESSREAHAGPAERDNRPGER
jgi:hypothetical protein